jgi:toxin ParE1/3/4
MTYYEDVGGPKLAEEFYSELRQFFQNAANNPEAHSIRERDLRRVNLERFPYHFLFRIVNDCVRVLVVRHHSRRPSLGRWTIFALRASEMTTLMSYRHFCSPVS